MRECLDCRHLAMAHGLSGCLAVDEFGRCECQGARTA